jgi:IgGFc binding protein
MFLRDATAGAHVAQRGTSTVAQRRRGRAPAPIAALLALVVFGCRKGADAVDASQEGGADAAPCAGATTCDGTSVRACRAGAPAEVIEECGPGLACSLGRCVSATCAKAEQNLVTFLGCTFYTFDLDNVTSDDAIPTSVIVTNPGQVAATVTLEHRNLSSSSWTGTTSLTVPPMRAARFSLADAHPEDGGRAAGLALRVSSDLPVSVAHVQSDDSTPGGSTSSGGTLLLPAHVLGSRYRAITYVQAATPRLADTPGSRGGAGQLVIVGTIDGTQVTITPSSTAAFGPSGGAPAPDPQGRLRLALDDGDVYTLYSTRDGSDLSGSEIAADHPVAVFSGNISTTYGITATGISSPDLAHEQLMPVAAWSTTYVAAQLTPEPAVFDPLLTPEGSSIWTIVADQPNTNVRFYAAAGPPPTPDRIIGAGEAFHFSVVGDFAVSASSPIQVMQGMDCEPSLSSAVPTAAWLTDYWFGALANFDTMIAIVRMAGEPVFLDGAKLEDSLFQAAGMGFDVARIPLGACPSAAVVCPHHLEGKFGFTMRGMDVLASYALTAPTWPCVDAADTRCIK